MSYNQNNSLRWRAIMHSEPIGKAYMLAEPIRNVFLLEDISLIF